VLREDVGQRKLDHELGDERYHHGDKHVAGRAEGGHDAELHADPSPRQAHDADESRAFGDYVRIAGNEERDEGGCEEISDDAGPFPDRDRSIATGILRR
jgi:hypothetical protein